MTNVYLIVSVLLLLLHVALYNNNTINQYVDKVDDTDDVVDNESANETFVPTTVSKQTWSDWDNYSADYGNTREYWGEYVPGGGWTGSPYSPDNNPSGIHMLARPKKIRRNINIATASAEELSDLIRSDIMR